MNDKNAQRTKWVLGIATVLALLISIWRLPRKPHSVPVVGLDFVGFTNSGRGVEALFALTNPPNAAINGLSVSTATQGDHSSATEERGTFTWCRRESWGLAYAITVDTTNEPLRVVLTFQQRAAGPRRIIEQVRELFGEITHHERDFFTGRVFFVTNETRINSSTINSQLLRGNL